MNKKLTLNQVGMTSIMVTMILSLVISLIVLGFAKIVRREQRQALDRQLNTQAYYAAETGVNDAVKALTSTPAYVGDKTNCAPDAGGPLNAAAATLDATSSVQYTCLLIDQTPSSLDYDTISQTEYKVIPIQAQNPGNITSITLGWQDTDGGNSLACPAVNNFPPVGGWGACDAGALRIDLVPVRGVVNRSTLNSDVMSAVLKPVSGGGGSLNYTAAKGFGGQGAIVNANCAVGLPGPGNKLCKVTIDVSGASSDTFYLRVKSFYKDNSLTITALQGAGGANFVGAQAIIDSTGKANDVLRRIQVHVPIAPDDQIKPEALESVQTICKRMSVPAAGVPVFDADPACSP